MPELPYLTEFNDYICRFYQSLSERFNTFELAFQFFFSRLTRLKSQYILLAVNTLDSIMQKHAQIEAERKRYKQELRVKTGLAR